MVDIHCQTNTEPYTTAASTLTYPESVSFRPGTLIAGWPGQQGAAPALEHAAPYLPPIRDFMSAARVDMPTSSDPTYASPSMHYAPGPSHGHIPQRVSFNSSLPPAPVISLQQEGKESSAPPLVFRRSNNTDLLNASNDDTSQNTTTSRSVPPPERGPVMPSSLLTHSSRRGSPAIDGTHAPISFDLESGRAFPTAGPGYPYNHHPAEYHSDRTQGGNPRMRDLARSELVGSVAEPLGSEPSLGQDLDRRHTNPRQGNGAGSGASDLYYHTQA
jgi:hypothetical protein